VSKGVVGLIAGVVALLVFGVVGCGDGDSTEEALTKAQFLRQGNAICFKKEKERNDIINEEGARLSGKTKNLVAEQEKLVLKILPTYEESAAGLDELGAPEGDEKQVEAIVKAMEEAAEKVKADPGTAVTTSLPFKKPNELNEGYGLKACVT
jgi:hypothetical protein